MATTLPAELKPISPYLARATELAKAEPVISYWCTYYAVQHAMTLGISEPESNEFLFGLMDKLEALKVELAGNEAVTEDAAAAAYIENFALKIFAQADNEDRTGKATRLTAKKFLAAANFLELLSVFGDQNPDNRDKIMYSKWKASDIAKAFREGRQPVPGPAGGLPEPEPVETPSELPAAADEVTGEEEKELAREFAALEAKEQKALAAAGAGQETGAEATSVGVSEVATSPPQDEPASYPFPVLPSAPTASAPPGDDEPEEEARTPAFPTFLDTPKDVPGERGVSPSSDDTLVSAPPAAPPTHQTAELPAPPPHPASQPSAFPSAVFPPAAPVAPSLPPPPPQPTYAPPPVARPPPPQASAVPSAPLPIDDSSLPTSLDPNAITKIQKHAKWAISALNYEDLVTARKELRLALAMLEGRGRN